MSYWQHRPVLVTGATGLLGSWLTDALVARGANVTCLIRDWVPSSRLIAGETLARVTVVRGELEQYETTLRCINEHEINTVFHLGAQTIVGTAARSALSTFEANIRGTWTLLEACRACKGLVRGGVLVASSDKAYGEHAVLPYREEFALQGRFPYDVSKACADLIALCYHRTYGVPIAITRCGNLYGGGDLNFSRIVPGTIRSLLLGERPVVRSDGTPVRDYVYVEDAVHAYLQIAERLPEPELWGEAFNVGPERPMSVLEMVEAIGARIGSEAVNPIVLNEATDEIPRQYLDCSKIRRMLGWHPQYSLEEGLDRTIRWYREYLERF